MIYGDSVVPIVYYAAESHPELESEAGRARANWYGVEPTLLPLAFFDGTNRAPQVTLPDSFYPIYRNMTDGARARKTFLELKLDSTVIDSQRIAIQVHIEPTDSTVNEMTGLRLVAVVYEDSVPYYSLLMGDTVYISRVVRNVVGDRFRDTGAVKVWSQLRHPALGTGFRLQHRPGWISGIGSGCYNPRRVAVGN